MHRSCILKSLTKVAIVFPGQGSQCSGMFASLQSTKYLAACIDAITAPNDKQELHEAFTTESYHGDAILRETHIAQPAVFAHSMALFHNDVFQKHIVQQGKIAVAAGHSLGHLSALCASQAMAFDDCMSLTAARGMAMQPHPEATESGMMALYPANAEFAEEVCAHAQKHAYREENTCVVATCNSASQFVLSGHREALLLAAAHAKKCYADFNLHRAPHMTHLPVGNAFHSPLMRDAQASLANTLWEFESRWQQGVVPVLSNIDGKIVDAKNRRVDLIRQMTVPVRWDLCTETLRSRTDISHVLELGPRPVLTPLLRKAFNDAMIKIDSATTPQELEVWISSL